MENISKRHVELPSSEGVNDLTPQDQLIYLGIRSYMNKDTLKAFPSQQAIADRVGCCRNTVIKSIKNLIDKEYIKVEKDGKKSIYTFNKFKQFEPFSYEFLEDRDNSFIQRALLASSQQYMYDKESGVGKIKYTKMELAQKINMPYSTLVRITRELSDKNIIETSDKKELLFNLNKYHQGIVTALLNHENRLDENEMRIQQLEKELAELKNRLDNKPSKEIII